MTALKNKILELVASVPGLTDREMTDRLLGLGVGQQALNQVARKLASEGRIARRPRQDGKIGNYPTDSPHIEETRQTVAQSLSSETISEDQVKRSLQAWLETAGWQVSVAWGRGQGIDLDARRNGERWIIEAKGCGSLNAMRVNYFLAILGELLQRMNDPDARYSIALPDMKQYRGLWERLPQLAKSCTAISALFVDCAGNVVEVPPAEDLGQS